MLQAADAVDSDTFAGEIVDPLKARFGDQVKRRLTQCDQDAFEGRALTCGDYSSGVSRQIIDLARSQSGHRQRSGHLNQFGFQAILFEQSGIAGDKEIEKRNAKGRIG